MRKDGKFVGVDGTIPEGQGIVMAHLNECHELLEMVRYQLCGCFHHSSLPSQLKQRMDEGDEDEDYDEDVYTFESGSDDEEDRA